MLKCSVMYHNADQTLSVFLLVIQTSISLCIFLDRTLVNNLKQRIKNMLLGVHQYPTTLVHSAPMQKCQRH